MASLRIILRRVKAQKSLWILNIAGLSLGLTAAIFAFLYVHHELNYDAHQTFYDNIVHVNTEYYNGDELAFHSSGTPASLLPTLKEEIPGIKNFVRMTLISRNARVETATKVAEVEEISAADSTLFDIFDFRAVSGDLGQAIRTPGHVVISEEIAKLFFGEGDAIGKELTINSKDRFIVGAVRANNTMPSNLPDFPIIISWQDADVWSSPNWIYNISHQGFLLLDEDMSVQELEMQMADAIERHMRETLDNANANMILGADKLKDLHFSPLIGMVPATTYSHLVLIASVGLLILVIACLNSINLSTATSITQSHFVGVCKAIGASSNNVRGYFLTESVTVAFVALLIAFAAIPLFLPHMEQLLDIKLYVTLERYSWLIPLSIGFTVFVGLLAGAYPSLVLSKFSPALVIGGKFVQSNSGRRLRSTLVVIQFVISIFLLICMLVSHQQFKYMNTKDLGFNKEQVLAIRLPDWDLMGRSSELRAELENLPGIIKTSDGDQLPNRSGSSPFGIPEQGPTALFQMSHQDIGYGWLELMGIDIKQGRFFDKEITSDENVACIINQTAANELGWDSAIDKEIVRVNDFGTMEGTTMRVIGVVEDYHFHSLYHQIRPLFLKIYKGRPVYIFARVDAENIQPTMNEINIIWSAFTQDYPLRARFIDEYFDQIYQSELRFSHMFRTLSIMAIIVACLGLYGLATFESSFKRREISIRKVLGAEVAGLVLNMSKGFIVLMLLASVLAWPIAWLVMGKWLDNFAYHMNITPWPFFLAGIIALFSGLFIVVLRYWKAANTNPVDVLRNSQG